MNKNMMRGADRWFWPLLRSKRNAAHQPIEHVFLAVCDHFEPLHGTDEQGALDRLQRWAEDYPRLAGRYRGADGRGPRHSFFFPIEQYDPAHLRLLSDICTATGSEIEVQLHHDHDTAASLGEKLRTGIAQLSAHGCLPKDRQGRTRFGFVHGNWSLCNSRSDGRWCGVPDEIAVLRAHGCYADFTFPSAPSETQPRAVNQIGYARECNSARALDTLLPACAGSTQSLRDSMRDLLLVQGPLDLNWSRRKWGILPRLENADLTRANPPTLERLRLWARQRIHVIGKPGWVFIKLHSHGAVPANADALIGPPAEQFHAQFTTTFAHELGAQVHYVTAREMVNLIHAAEDETSAPLVECLDHWLCPPNSQP